MTKAYVIGFSVALAGLLVVTGCLAPRPAPLLNPQPMDGGVAQGSPGIPPRPYYAPYGAGNGGTVGPGGMGGGMMGGSGGMMGGQGGPAAPYGAPVQAITIDQAVRLAQQYAASPGNPDIILDEVEEFTNNFYARYREKGTGTHAFEMLIDKFNGAIYPEQGPNMMWNTKYGPIASMVGPGSSPAIPMSMTPQQAVSVSQSFLAGQFQGATVGGADAFYGYYTVEVKRGGKPFGMLSVNGYSGQVWFHTWHGDFIQRREMNG